MGDDGKDSNFWGVVALLMTFGPIVALFIWNGKAQGIY